MSDSMDEYLKTIGKSVLLTADKERELALRVSRGDEEARKEMIISNLRLVVGIAKNYVGRGLALSDLIAEGNIGLMQAVDKFDHTKGGKLSTYADHWIRHAISRAIANQGRTIRLPVEVSEEIGRWLRVSRVLAQKLGRKPSVMEVATKLGVTEARVEYLAELAQEPTSEMPVSSVSSTEDVAEAVPANGREIVSLLSNLDEDERKTIIERFGLSGGNQKTLDEIGRGLMLTRQRVGQIQAEAMAKLRVASEEVIKEREG